MNKLTEKQQKILKDITINYIKLVKQRFKIDIDNTIKDINRYIVISNELTKDEYKVKKYLENILENNIHILNEMNNIEEIKKYIYEKVNIEIDNKFIINIIKTYLNKINSY